VRPSIPRIEAQVMARMVLWLEIKKSRFERPNDQKNMHPHNAVFQVRLSSDQVGQLKPL
jgi:hypothetical protein